MEFTPEFVVFEKNIIEPNLRKNSKLLMCKVCWMPFELKIKLIKLNSIRNAEER